MPSTVAVFFRDFCSLVYFRGDLRWTMCLSYERGGRRRGSFRLLALDSRTPYCVEQLFHSPVECQSPRKSINSVSTSTAQDPPWIRGLFPDQAIDSKGIDQVNDSPLSVQLTNGPFFVQKYIRRQCQSDQSAARSVSATLQRSKVPARSRTREYTIINSIEI